MHSAFLAELLNPKGSHDHNDRFLNLFIDQFQIEDFDCKNAEVHIEKFIGCKTADSGGRIDIYIKSPNGKRILIENKIYAGDQENQLIRYHNYDLNATIIYLTLDGKQPSEYSLNNRKKSVNKNVLKCCSYNRDIVSWLEACRKEVTTHSSLKETITQYISLIKYLTNQSINHKMSTEIKDLLKQSLDNFKSAHEGSILFNELNREILGKTENELKRRYSDHHLSNERIESGDYLINLEIDWDEDGIYIGFTATRDGNYEVCREPKMLSLYNILKKIASAYKNTHNHIGWRYPRNVARKILDIETVFELCDDEKRKIFIETIIKEGEGDWEVFKRNVEQLK